MSLGLVSYDDSDESDNNVDSDNESDLKACESKEKPESPVILNNPLKKANPSNVLEILSDDDEPVAVATNRDTTSSLHIPESKMSLINTDIDIKRLTSSNTKNGRVQITIPSLNQVEEDTEEEPKKKKLKPSQKGSGLFALLPNPKSSLVPQSVFNRSKPVTKKPTPAAISKRANQITKPVLNTALKSSLINYEDSGDEEESSGNVDFFSLDSKEDDVTPAPIDVDVDFPSVSQPLTSEVPEEETSSKPLSFNSSFQPQTWAEASASQLTSSSMTSQYPTSEFMSFSSNALELDQEAMQQLCGRRDRLKMTEVNLIDVSGDAIMPDSREWLTKQLTEEQAHRPSHKKKDGPTSQQKRKHQITYLAYQAKENELELKNQWANNRMSRKQTQAKYGF